MNKARGLNHEPTALAKNPVGDQSLNDEANTRREITAVKSFHLKTLTVALQRFVSQDNAANMSRRA